MKGNIRPVVGKFESVSEVESISLRDYFAGQAINRPRIYCAKDAYAWADAMIEERNRE